MDQRAFKTPEAFRRAKLPSFGGQADAGVPAAKQKQPEEESV
jgi:hypothetical protein